MNEVDNVKKFQRITDFPSVKHLLESDLRDHSVIEKVLREPDGQKAFEATDRLFQMLICVYDYPDMAKLRDLMVQKMWKTWTVMNKSTLMTNA